MANEKLSSFKIYELFGSLTIVAIAMWGGIQVYNNKSTVDKTEKRKVRHIKKYSKNHHETKMVKQQTSSG